MKQYRRIGLVVGGVLFVVFCLGHGVVSLVEGKEDRWHYYNTLNVPKDADDKAIKRAYRKMALKWHPDRNQGNEEEASGKFKEIAEAYEVLSNPEARKIYDQYGKDGLKGGGGGGRGGEGGFGGFGFNGFKFQDANDIFKQFFGDKDPFANFEELFEDVKVDEFFGGAEDTKKSLRSALEVFYKTIGKKYAQKKVASLVEKYVGKETKLVRGLIKKYRKQYPQAVKVLESAFASFKKGDEKFGGFGSFGNAFQQFGGMGGINFNFGGGGAPGSTFSFSSTTVGSDGKTRTKSMKSTTSSDGRRVTQTIESDGDRTTASMEERIGDRVTRKRGTKARSALPGTQGARGEL